MSDDWKVRLHNETMDLRDKLVRLSEFIDGKDTGFSKMSPMDRSLLIHQRQAMKHYLDILNTRCQRAGIEVYTEVTP